MESKVLAGSDPGDVGQDRLRALYAKLSQLRDFTRAIDPSSLEDIMWIMSELLVDRRLEMVLGFDQLALDSAGATVRAEMRIVDIDTGQHVTYSAYGMSRGRGNVVREAQDDALAAIMSNCFGARSYAFDPEAD